MSISTVDLCILVAWLLTITALGMWVGGRQRSAADYSVGSRNLPWWAILGSIIATETSTVTFLSIPGIAFRGDLTWLQIPIGFAIGRMVVVWLFMPHYFSGKLLTAYEVLHRRFGGGVKQFASLLFLVTRTMADGVRLFLSALVLQQVADVDLATSVLCVGTATMAFTFVGGMRAVVWTDCVQLVVYIAGALIALWVMVDGIDGGFGGMIDTAAAADKLRVFDTVFAWDNAQCLWAGLIGGAFVALGSHGADQLLVQRYLSARSQRQAAVALCLPLVIRRRR